MCVRACGMLCMFARIVYDMLGHVMYVGIYVMCVCMYVCMLCMLCVNVCMYARLLVMFV